MKGKVYKSYVRSAMLHESKTWCLRENEVAVLGRAERSKVRAMCGEQAEYSGADRHVEIEESSR